jgi:hypothetical protein
MSRLLDLLIGIGEALCPPWKRRSPASQPKRFLLSLKISPDADFRERNSDRKLPVLSETSGKKLPCRIRSANC